MNKYLLSATLLAVITSCSDDKTIDTPREPAQPGSEVRFSLNLGDNTGSRTIYGDEVGNKFPIYWVNKDEVLMASPQCSPSTATYEISVEGDKQNYATAMNHTGASGLQWGEQTDASFYSIYPDGYHSDPSTRVDNKLTVSGDAATADINIRRYQVNVFTKDANSNTWKGTPYDLRQIGSTADGHNQRNPDAVMYAQKRHAAADGNEVALQYHPFTTAFHVTLDGYTLGTGTSVDNITIQEVVITAPTNIQLVGNFTAAFNADATTAPTVTGSGVDGINNEIHITTLQNDVSGRYLTITPGEKVSFNCFAIPVGGNVTADWTLTVRTDHGTFRRPLTPSTSGQLIAGMMHKLNMPSFPINNAQEFNVATWIQQIPRNVYLSELSLPGAWYAGQAEYQGGVTYANLYAAGVRAFAIETRSASGYRYVTTPDRVVVSGTGTNGHTGNHTYYYGGTRIQTVINEIAARINSGEYAVLVFSYADGGEGGHRAADYAYWLQGIRDEIAASTATNIYTDAITPNTTVGDVLGKLIIKVNVGGNLPGGNIAIGNYASNMSALLSYTDARWETGGAENSSLISQMYWQRWSNDYMTNYTGAIGNIDANSLYFNYTSANRTHANSGDANGLPTYAERVNAINNLVKNSRAVYESAEHNVWFYVGVGGNEAESTTSDTNSSTAQSFASTMNSELLNIINNKIDSNDFSPLGMVMCNYITNSTYHGPEIVNAIIKMNRLFRLNRDPNQAEWPGQADPAAEFSTTTPVADGWNAVNGHLK